jgi:hypothetical protein
MKLLPQPCSSHFTHINILVKSTKSDVEIKSSTLFEEFDGESEGIHARTNKLGI